MSKINQLNTLFNNQIPRSTGSAKLEPAVSGPADPQDKMTWSTCPVEPLPSEKEMRAMARQLSGGPKEDNILQKGITTLGGWIGGGFRWLGDRAGDAAADVVMNPWVLTPGGSALGRLGGGSRLELPGQKMVSEIARSAVRGVGEFGGSTVEGVAGVVSHPVETVQGLATVGGALTAQIPLTGDLQVKAEAFLSGKTSEQVRQEKTQTLIGIKDAVVEDFQTNEKEIGLPGAVVKAGLDIFGIPKAAATMAPKVAKLGQAVDPPIAVAPKTPVWLKLHRPNADEIAAAGVRLSSGELARGRQLLERLDEGKGPVFHATGSDALEGLAKTGELLPARELARRGLTRSTGEGTTLFDRAERGFVSLGEGREGLGSVLGYNDRMTKPPFSFSALSDQELASESARLSKLAQDPDFARSAPGMERQASARLNQIQGEMTRRVENPRSTPQYPIIFGFKRDGLDLQASSDVPGEVRATAGLSLKDNLESVMVPQRHLSEMAAYLDRNLGPGHGVEILPTETLHQLKPEYLDLYRTYSQASNNVAAAHFDNAVAQYQEGR